MEVWIADFLQSLRTDVAAANFSGNVEGLLARQIIGDDSRFQIYWDVDCDEIWLQSSYDPSSLPSVAALGYTMAHRYEPRFAAALNEGLQRATTRDPSIAGPGAALHDPAVLIGLALAAQILRSSEPRFLAWCGQVLRGLTHSSSLRIDPMIAYAAHLCSLDIGPSPIDVDAPLNYCAALDWWRMRPAIPS